MGFFNVQIGNTMGFFKIYMLGISDFFKISEPDISGFFRIFRSYRKIADVLRNLLKAQQAGKWEVEPDTHSHRNLFLNKHFTRQFLRSRRFGFDYFLRLFYLPNLVEIIFEIRYTSN